MQQPGSLLRILGSGFGIAVVVGGSIGVGILRTPGDVAARLGNIWLVVGIWILGGIYALLGSNAVAELGTMTPRAGGFYVYARRAFGDGVGLMVGASDCLGLCVAIAYAAVTIADFTTVLWPPAAGSVTPIACGLILLLGLLHWTGLRVSSRAQEWTTAVKGLAFLALVAACFWFGRAPGPTSASLAGAIPAWRLFVPFFVALQAVIVTYDGWYCAIYFTEEDRDPARNLPRSIIGGTLTVTAVYLLVNFAFLRVLPLQDLAASKMPASDAVRSFAGAGAAKGIIWLAALSLLPMINAVLLCATRVLYGMSRDGLVSRRASSVNPRGTPGPAMWLCVGAAMLFALSGTFQTLLAIAGFIFVVNHSTAYVSLLVLRRREPLAPRPFKSLGYPWTAVLALGGAVSFLIGCLISDPKHSLIALALVAIGYPLYRLVHRFAPVQRAATASAGD